MAQRNSPLQASLRRGRADDLRADAGRRRGAASRCRSPFERRAARDRLQPGLPARGHRVGHLRRGAAQADHAAPAAVCSRARATTYVPDHADPPRRLIVQTVALRNIRSYAKLELELQPGLVLVVGPNGAGKTNLLESLHVGTQGFSPRTRTDAQLVRFGEAVGRVALRGRRGGDVARARGHARGGSRASARS